MTALVVFVFIGNSLIFCLRLLNSGLSRSNAEDIAADVVREKTLHLFVIYGWRGGESADHYAEIVISLLRRPGLSADDRRIAMPDSAFRPENARFG
ncbi:hypothetical protein, partial [Undibacterium luofuense]|uniref:hypothetical protein n=1 Tax=Undibacterium luofuense TaxID=2828733 RepID=UPI0030EB8EEB